MTLKCKGPVFVVIALSLLTYSYASGQTMSQPTPAPNTTTDLSQLTYQALTDQTDAAKQDINDLNTQIGWLQSLASSVGQLKQMENDKSAKIEDKDALRKQIKDYEGYAQVPVGTAMNADLPTLTRQKQASWRRRKSYWETCRLS